MPYIFALISAAGYGFNDLCVHYAMKSGRATVGQALVINLISGNMLLLLVAGVIFRINGFPPLNWVGILFFVLSGLMAPFMGRILNFTAIKHIGATRATTIRVSDTFFTMVIASILLKDSIPFSSIAGAVLLVIGVVMLINETNKSIKPAPVNNDGPGFRETAAAKVTAHIPFNFKATILGLTRGINLGSLLALASAFFFAFGGVLRQSGLEYVPSAILGSVAGSLTALVTNGSTVCFSGQLGNKWNIPRKTVLVLAVGGIGNSMGLLMFFLALTSGGQVSMAAALKNTSPLFTLMLTWAFLRKTEKFSVKLLASICLVITGAFFLVLFK